MTRIWTRRHRALAERLGLPSVARRIEHLLTVWIVPTAAAEYALQVAGFLPKDEP